MQMKTDECFVVQDLFTLYAEQLTNEVTTEYLNEHLAKCKHCKKAYEEMLEEEIEKKKEQQARDNKLVRSLKRYRYETIGFIVGLLLPILLIAGWIFYNANHTTNDVRNATTLTSDYGVFKDYKGVSKLIIFPTVQEGNNITRYYYSYDKVWGDDMCQIYMEYKFDTKDEFDVEKERLLELTYEKTGKKVLYDEEEFIYPAVFAMRYDKANEYVLMNEEEQKMIYIYLQNVGKREINFSELYILRKYGEGSPDLYDSDAESFNIYN